jgi:hypothetical protein
MTWEAAMREADRIAGEEIHRLAKKYGLRDEYENAPGSRYGHYVGSVNGAAFSCFVYDRDPSADLRALRLALGIPPAVQPEQLPLFAPLRKDVSENGQVLSEVEQ